jgi:hypothetical protein
VGWFFHLGSNRRTSVIAIVDTPDDFLEKITREDFTFHPLIIVSQNNPSEEMSNKIRIDQMVFMFNMTTLIQSEVYSINDIRIEKQISKITDGKFHSGQCCCYHSQKRKVESAARRQVEIDKLKVASRKRQVGSGKSKAASWKRQVERNKSEAASRKWQVGSGKSEAASQKQQVKSGKSEAANPKRQVERNKLEVASWKRLVGSGKSEAASRKRQVGSGKSEAASQKQQVGSGK